jgi:chemotaxis protein methyltransferase CheR
MPADMSPTKASMPPMPAPIVASMPTPLGGEVSDKELSRYADLIYKYTGIRVSPQKKALLSNRLRRRLRDTGLKSFSEYYDYLTGLSSAHPEWEAFLQEITTHETYLFRDQQQWDWLKGYFAEAVAKGTRSIRFWSAACSTGDEAATIACLAAAAFPNAETSPVQIVGTDIGVGAVETASKSTFSERAMRLVPDDLRRRFFTFDPNTQMWKAKPALTRMMSFRQHNLLQRLKDRPFDVIFLKNVLIYFDTASKRTTMSNIQAQMNPGACLVVGPTEGVADLVHGLTRVQPWLYRKPHDERSSS